MDEFAAESDAQLMRRSQAGEPAAFSELASRYRSALTRLAVQRLGDEALADEAVQDAFMSAYRWRHAFDPRYAFRTWLWTILLNQCKQIAGRRRRRPDNVRWSECTAGRSLESGHAPEIPAAETAPPWSGMLQRERAELLEQCLDELSPVQAEAVRLRFFGGLQFAEIAQRQACSLSTAKNRVKWGLMRLSSLLNQRGHADLLEASAAHVPTGLDPTTLDPTPSNPTALDVASRHAPASLPNLPAPRAAGPADLRGELS